MAEQDEKKLEQLRAELDELKRKRDKLAQEWAQNPIGWNNDRMNQKDNSVKNEIAQINREIKALEQKPADS